MRFVSPRHPALLCALIFLSAISFAVTVNVTSPTSSTVSTSFTLQAYATSGYPITGWTIYVDGNTAWSTPGPTSSISVPLNVSSGGHTIVARAWDTSGAYGSRSLSLTASTSTSSSSGVSVSVKSPSTGACVGSPVYFSASGSSPNGISGWVIYMDNQNVYQVNNYSNSLSANVSLPGGWHSIYVRAWDRVTGAYGTSPTFSINVGSTSSSALPAPPSSAHVWYNLEQSTSNWSSCSDCAGGAYTSNYWKAFWQSSPSMDGASLEFFNGGGAWADVLWIKKLGSQNWATNFLWDFYVYFDSTTAANLWSAEYDLWQSVGRYEFMIGSQCVFGTGEWDTWDQAHGRWVQTSIPCNRFSPGSWHHIQYYLQRLSGNRYKYVTLVVDGHSYAVNQTYYAGWSGWSDDLGVQWQLDLNGYGTDAHEWVEKVKLSIW